MMTRTKLPPMAANTAVLSDSSRFTVEPVDLRAADGAFSSGLLYQPAGKTTRVGAHLMHPRTDQTRNYNIGPLVDAGFTVLARSGRSVNNDAETLHEELLLDVAAGVRLLRDRGCDSVVLVGNSGGAPLAAMYQAQAELPPARRIGADRSVASVVLATADLPAADAFISVGGHLGQGQSLLRLLDASVVDERDPRSVDSTVDIYDPANGFTLPVRETRYEPEFVAAVRAAQLQRMRHLDRLALAALARSNQSRALARQLPESGITDTARFQVQRSAATREYLVIYRTVADPALLDLSLDPDDRVAGGFDSHPRPDIQNFAQAGFAHYLSPRAWLSTWSATSTNANMLDNLRSVTVPSLFVHYAGDIFVRLGDLREMEAASGAPDKKVVVVRTTDHYGREILPDGTLGARVTDGTAAACDWLLERFTP
jgi:pimeloyl-ACP methyl ester carboxylesterase